MKRTGLKDKNGLEICVGHKTELILSDGTRRVFDVKKGTVIRKVVNHPDFVEDTSKVAITGYYFKWEGYELFPCVDQDGMPDNEKMTILNADNYTADDRFFDEEYS